MSHLFFVVFFTFTDLFISCVVECLFGTISIFSCNKAFISLLGENGATWH